MKALCMLATSSALERVYSAVRESSNPNSKKRVYLSIRQRAKSTKDNFLSELLSFGEEHDVDEVNNHLTMPYAAGPKREKIPSYFFD